MQAVLQIMGVAVLLAAVAPVAMAGGQMIAAFMLGRHILQWVGITSVTMLLLVAGATLALRAVMPFFEGGPFAWLAPLASAAAVLAGPWLTWILGQRWMELKETT